MADEVYDATSVALDEGDVLLLYTDGVVEATNADGEMLGEDGLIDVLRRAAAGDAAEILESVFDAVEAFSATPDQGDDVTVVVVRVTAQGVSQG